MRVAERPFAAGLQRFDQCLRRDCSRRIRHDALLDLSPWERANTWLQGVALNMV
jgi:hypothetical protein